MSNRRELENDLRDFRSRRGWSQEELARQAGISRAEVSAIEIGRLVPSAAAVLALAGALGCRVEDLFRLPGVKAEGVAWAWPAWRLPCRYWKAEVGGRIRYFPVEPTALGMASHDGVAREDGLLERGGGEPARTLVVACCDPAVGLLAAELARAAGVRLIAFVRSSRTALSLLEQGLVHAAGVHLAGGGEPLGNAEVVQSLLGPGFCLLHATRWEEGIALAPALKLPSIRDAVRAELRWIGRDVGSGARQCLDEVLGPRRSPRKLAHDHRGVAAAIRSGWADAGICLRLVCEEAGLDFLCVRRESYDLCFPESAKDDPRIQALIAAVRSSSYRRLLGELPGYDSSETGALQRVERPAE